MEKVFLDPIEGMSRVTLHVKIRRVKEFQARVWVAMKLIALAALVLNCNIAVDDEASDGE